eukprot:TRINITY_DN4798_c0_g1_i2.p1 TRINITY_DN4798_c0_g1~~TRINITY_DN4798_c0_g1_i2.p1  ORF type:complete len:248 (-),score=45.70 TRINITY_DN4798_c0_g1_i2:344-1087(-)
MECSMSGIQFRCAANSTFQPLPLSCSSKLQKHLQFPFSISCDPRSLWRRSVLQSFRPARAVESPVTEVLKSSATVSVEEEVKGEEEQDFSLKTSVTGEGKGQEEGEEEEEEEEEEYSWRVGGRGFFTDLFDDEFALMNISRPVNVGIFVGEDEPADSVISRFNREVRSAGIFTEYKRRRFHETNQEKRKRKHRDYGKVQNRNRRRLKKSFLRKLSKRNQSGIAKEEEEDIDDESLDDLDIEEGDNGL